MKTGNGKIANLPSHIRDQLNYHLAEGEEGIELVEWLNAKPEVTEVVNKLFDGTPISEQNLSEWRKRGYQKWLAFHNFVDESNELGDNAEVIATTGIDCDKPLLTLTAAYADMIQNWIVTPCEGMTYKLAVYKNLTNGVLALQRAELQKVRLEIARERLELLREKRSNKSLSSSGPSTEAIGRGAGVGASGCPGKGGGPGKSRATGPSASSPESAPGSHQSPAPPESHPEMEGSPANAGSLPRVEAPNAPDDSPIPKNTIPPKPVPSPAASNPAPKPKSSALPVNRRPNDPPNFLHGIPIIRELSVRPAPYMAPGTATQMPKPSAPKVTPARAPLQR